MAPARQPEEGCVLEGNVYGSGSNCTAATYVPSWIDSEKNVEESNSRRPHANGAVFTNQNQNRKDHI